MRAVDEDSLKASAQEIAKVHVIHNRPMVKMTVTYADGAFADDIFTTMDHPFHVDGKGWTAVEDMAPGDQLISADGAPMLVKSIEAEGYTATTYNLTVANAHTFFVGEERIWVHNQNGDCGDGGDDDGLGISGTTSEVTEIIDGVTVIDRRSGRVFEGTVDLGPTLDRIENGGSFPHRRDGTEFRNEDEPNRLPIRPDGYYTEYVHPTPDVRGPGPQRIVRGQNGELYYTPDHYDTFIPLNGGALP